MPLTSASGPSAGRNLEPWTSHGAAKRSGRQSHGNMMILVDTSVWIRFLGNKAPYALRLDELLEKDEVVGHEFVYGELLIGDRGGRSKFLAIYQGIQRASFVPHSEVASFVRDRGLSGRGIGWIDAHLIA